MLIQIASFLGILLSNSMVQSTSSVRNIQSLSFVESKGSSVFFNLTHLVVVVLETNGKLLQNCSYYYNAKLLKCKY